MKGLRLSTTFLFYLCGIVFLGGALITSAVPVNAGDVGPFGQRLHSTGTAVTTNIVFFLVAGLFLFQTANLLVFGGAMVRYQIVNDELRIPVDNWIRLGVVTVKRCDAFIADIFTYSNGDIKLNIKLNLVPIEESLQTRPSPPMLCQRVNREHKSTKSSVYFRCCLDAGSYSIEISGDGHINQGVAWKARIGISPALRSFFKTQLALA